MDVQRSKRMKRIGRSSTTAEPQTTSVESHGFDSPRNRGCGFVKKRQVFLNPTEHCQRVTSPPDTFPHRLLLVHAGPGCGKSQQSRALLGDWRRCSFDRHHECHVTNCMIATTSAMLRTVSSLLYVRGRAVLKVFFGFIVFIGFFYRFYRFFIVFIVFSSFL